MATGSYDANGIWQYGEDDNIALFSDLLKLGTLSTSSAFTADRARIATLEAGSLSGLIPVKPTSVVIATGTGAANDVGLITFTGASAVSLNGVFTTGYNKYRIIVDLTSNTGLAESARIRFRKSGTDNSSGNYARQGFFANGTTISNYSEFNQTACHLIEAASTGRTLAIMDISNPFNKPAYLGDSQSTSFSSYNYRSSMSGVFNVVDTFDGASLVIGAGTMTGSIQIFAYND